MEQELFIVTGSGRYKIDQELVKKYNLKKGSRTPFSGYLVTDRQGDATNEVPLQEGVKDIRDPKEEDDPITMDNGAVLSTAEMLDISQGVDSTI